MESLNTLLENFALRFPNIDFSKVNSGYNQVENLLVKHIDEFTADQWQAICDYHFNDLFQDGTPHVSWNTDRSDLCRALIRSRMPYKTYEETWYNVKIYSIKTNECVLEVKIEEPKIWSSTDRTHYYLKVTEEFKPVPTHRAIIIAIASDTKAYITNQFAGTESECEDWVAKTLKQSNSQYFKIMKI